MTRKASVLTPALLVPWVLLYLVLGTVADLLTFSVFGLPHGAHLSEAVRFFLYEAPKVLLLLTLVVFAVGVVRSYFSPERTRALLAGKSQLSGNALAGMLGIVTPFCSCSAVPLFIGFVEGGIPIGVTLSFLIAAPLINEVAVVLLLGLFGWQTALLYAGTGLVIAVGSGFVIGKLKVEQYVEPWVYETRPGLAQQSGAAMSFEERLSYGAQATREIVGNVWPYVLAGIAVGAGIHGYVPEDFMASIMGKSAWWSVPLAVLIGVPLYSNAAGIIPIVQALMAKGASLAFMMSVIGLSLPETIILRKVLKLPLIAIFIGVVAAGIITVGFLFNLVY